MSLDDLGVVKAVGLAVIHAGDEEALGVTADVLIGEEGQVSVFRIKHGWLSEDQMLLASQVALNDGRLVTTHREVPEVQENHSSPGHGLMGVPVQTRSGTVLGKVINVLVEPPSFQVVGLELSSGVVRDWIRGRSVVVLDSHDPVAVDSVGVIILPDEVDIEDESKLEGEQGNTADDEEATAPILGKSGVKSMDWARVRDTSEEEIRQEMARVVWERRGAPRNTEGESAWLEMVQPWAAALKRAGAGDDTHAFDDVALLSDDEMEALRPFRVGQEVKEPVPAPE